VTPAARLRARVLERLASGPATTRELADALGVAVLSATQAARVLERDGAVVTERTGRWTRVRLRGAP
jgi:DNA-binding transcriptional ArsR family regulator